MLITLCQLHRRLHSVNYFIKTYCKCHSGDYVKTATVSKTALPTLEGNVNHIGGIVNVTAIIGFTGSPAHWCNNTSKSLPSPHKSVPNDINMNTAPNSLPPRQQQQWISTCIPIDNVAGQPPINICDIFCYESFNLKGALILPPEMYPPQWDKRQDVESKIIESALNHDGTELVRSQTDHYSDGIRHSYLCCKYGIMHRSKSKLPDPHPDKENTREGIKVSRIVNKDKSSRGPQARKEPRRSQAKLPMNKEHLCQFKFRLTCEEGKHWTIAKKMKHDAIHINHSKTDIQHDRTSMASLTQEQRELAAYAGRVSPSGSAQKIMAKVTGRAPFSRQQLVHNQNKIEGGGRPKNVTDSQALINLLKDKVTTKEARYVALYHQVTENNFACHRQTYCKEKAAANAK